MRALAIWQMKALVTVGSTQFPELVDAVLEKEFLEALSKNGYTKLVVQHGSYSPTLEEAPANLIIECFPYTSDLTTFMKDSDLIIAHGGAGTAVEALRMHKRLVMVPNQKLLDNHQLELAKKLHQEGHCELCMNPKELPKLIFLRTNYKPLPPCDVNAIKSIF